MAELFLWDNFLAVLGQPVRNFRTVKLARVIAVLPVLLPLEVERILVRPTPGVSSHMLNPAKAPALICPYKYALHKLSPF